MKYIAATLPFGVTAMTGAAFGQAKKTVQEVTETTEREIQENKVEMSKQTQHYNNEIASETQKFEDAMDRRNQAAAAEEAAKDNAEAAEAEEATQLAAMKAHQANMDALDKAHKIKEAECAALKTRRTEQKRRMADALETLEKNAAKQNQGGAVSEGGVTQGSASSYEAQTGPIIKIFEKILGDISGQLEDEQETCQNFRQNYMLNHKDQTNLMKNAKDANANAHDTAVAERMTEAEQRTEKKNQQSAAADADKTRMTLTRDLRVFTNNMNQNLDDLNQQLEGLGKIMNLINSKVAGAKGLVFKQAVSLMQLNSEPAISGRVQSYLTAKGFSALAAAVPQNPLAKVKIMISEMINKLEVETANEEKQHGQCSDNLDQANNDMQNINDKLNSNSASLDTTESKINSNKETIAEMNSQIEELQNLIQTQTDDRAESKALFDKEISELTTAIEGLGEIIKLIETEMTDKVAEQLKPQFEAIRTTMRKTEGNKRSSESSDVSRYQQLMKSSKASMSKSKSILQETESSLSRNDAKRASLNKKIDAGKQSKQDQQKILLIVQKKCNNRMTHGEKIAKMKGEIQSLTEALAILEA